MQLWYPCERRGRNGISASRGPRRRRSTGRGPGRRPRPRPPAPRRRARVLLPEGGERAPRHDAQREPEARVFALDTHVLFPETYAVWREIEKRYGIQVEVFEGPSLGRQAATHGDALWERNPALCCSIRKVAPLGHALAGLDGWITGVAATSPPPAPTRRSSAGTSATSCGRRARWRTGPTTTSGPTSASMSCRSTSCTAAATPRSDARTHGARRGRDGRWSGLDKTECGLHA